MKPITNADVAVVFDGYPPRIRRKLLSLRRLILQIAESTEGVGELEETLKWGEPAYLTSRSKSGSTIRIAWRPDSPTRYAIHFNCRTNLVETFRERFPDDFEYVGNRSIVFDEDGDVPVEPLSHCLAAALTYHRDRKARRA